MADGKLLWRAARKGATAVIPTRFTRTVLCTSHRLWRGCNCQGHRRAAGRSRGASVREQDHREPPWRRDPPGRPRLWPFREGRLTCQEFKTGKVVWQSDQTGKGSLAYADGRFYLRAEDKARAPWRSSRPRRRLSGDRPFRAADRSGKENWPHPVIAGGQLYLRDQDVLLCYDVKAK